MPNVFSVKTLLELRAAFKSGLDFGAETEAHLGGALRQALDQPGNLVRGWLAYEVACAYGLSVARAKHMAVAIEYFHTASLIFDDLPFMDDATERRGGRCVHQTYGEAAAVLAGLGLVNRAYSLLWRGFAEASGDRRALAGDYVEGCLGVGGLLNGQSEDLHYGSLPQPRQSPERVATGKTVSLIRLSLVLPALLGGASSGEVRALERLATFWGLSYQILDDLKDVFSEPEQTGKTAGRDRSLNRPNLTLEIGPSRALRRLERLIDLGDRVLARLAAQAPALTFLEALSRRLRDELTGINVAILSTALSCSSN